MIDFFPKTTVTGDAFCNREEERKLLIKYITIGRHIWIQAHRRHGKTSLVAQAIEDAKTEHKLSYSRCHLRFASDMESCIRKLIQTIDFLIYDVLKTKHDDDDVGTFISKFSGIINNAFRRLKPSIAIQGGRPVISTTQTYDLNTLEDALSGLDNIANKFGVRVVMLIDEFQEIGKLTEHQQIESAIRQCVEDAQSTTFIFAGSERTLMAQSLGDKKRPLYKHTQPIELERIGTDCYLSHLSKLSEKQWQKKLDDQAFKEIMYLTQRHPYYVNWLCDELWLNQVSPTVESVQESWAKVVYHSSREDAHEIRSLTLNEKKLVIAIAKGFNQAMTSAKVASQLKMAPSSITRSLENLVRKDMIDKTQNQYYIVNPAIATQAVQEG